MGPARHIKTGLLALALGSSQFLMAESILEYHQRQCRAGEQSSCERARVMQTADEQALRIEQLGAKFAARINRDDYEENNKPDLEQAYQAVMQDFFEAEKDSGVKQTVNDQMLGLCAGHFHDHWVNRKLVWPTDAEQRPDWSTIYYYIVDHYYGYCVRSYLGGFSSSS